MCWIAEEKTPFGAFSVCKFQRLASMYTRLFFERGMIVALPAEVARGLVHGLRHVAEVRGHVMFEALATNILEQLLQLRYFRDACAAEGFERIVGEAARAG